MASMNMFLSPAATVPTGKINTTRPRRVQTFATAAKGSGGKTEKGLFEWLMGALEKDQDLVETDPILQKVEGKSGGTGTVGGKKGTTAVTTAPAKKSGGGEGGFSLGGLFTKK